MYALQEAYDYFACGHNYFHGLLHNLCMHRASWIANRWIVHRKLGQPAKFAPITSFNRLSQSAREDEIHESESTRSFRNFPEKFRGNSFFLYALLRGGFSAKETTCGRFVFSRAF